MYGQIGRDYFETHMISNQFELQNLAQQLLLFYALHSLASYTSMSSDIF